VRHPDIPAQVPLEYLSVLDSRDPGTWIAQPKMDGRRRIAEHYNTAWDWHAKEPKGVKPLAMPEWLRQEFESLPWPRGCVLDCEWTGMRKKGDAHMLFVFDILRADGAWLTKMAFKTRLLLLSAIFSDARMDTEHVRLLPCVKNPGLVDFFHAQTKSPLSEGVVVREASSGLILDWSKPAVNELWVKAKFRRA
jgi:ATP-dependent DNA ligase